MPKVCLEKDPIWSTIYYSDPTNWEDIQFPAQGLNPPGAVSDPDRDTTDGTFLFDSASTEIVCGLAQMPHAWKEGSFIYPHVHWQATDTGAGNVLWRFEYDIANIHGDFAGSYSNVDVLAAAHGTVAYNNVKSFPIIDMSGLTLSCFIKWKLSRIGGDGTDTYGADARLLEFDIHYQIDSVGSGLEFQK